LVASVVRVTVDRASSPACFRGSGFRIQGPRRVLDEPEKPIIPQNDGVALSFEETIITSIVPLPAEGLSHGTT
jgi:hypothetical protein